jgi:hypothetical protein
VPCAVPTRRHDYCGAAVGATAYTPLPSDLASDPNLPCATEHLTEHLHNSSCRLLPRLERRNLLFRTSHTVLLRFERPDRVERKYIGASDEQGKSSASKCSHTVHEASRRLSSPHPLQYFLRNMGPCISTTSRRQSTGRIDQGATSSGSQQQRYDSFS